MRPTLVLKLYTVRKFVPNTKLYVCVLMFRLCTNMTYTLFKFKVCKSVPHHTIQINHQLDATISPVYYLTFIYSPTCFGRNRPDHDQQYCYHHAPKVRPEAATAVVELLMMGVRTPETCWAVNNFQDNKLEKLLHLVGDLFGMRRSTENLGPINKRRISDHVVGYLASQGGLCSMDLAKRGFLSLL